MTLLHRIIFNFSGCHPSAGWDPTLQTLRNNQPLLDSGLRRNDKYFFRNKISAYILLLLAFSSHPEVGVASEVETKSFAYNPNEVILDYQIGGNADLLNYRMQKHQGNSYSPLSGDNIEMCLSRTPDSCFAQKKIGNRAMSEESRKAQTFRDNKAESINKKLNPDLDLEFSIPLY
ncbi:MAG: hypothetical protein JSS50_00360 [Proteobacteria bacterium]|nr:hypothetical protein [Pseudomonadota bacterium]